MKYLEDLKDKLYDELEEIARKPEMSAGDLEAAHKLTDTIKNIDKICMLEEDGGYSQAGDWEIEGRGNYGRGISYAGRKRDSMGRYSRDGSGRNYGGYSRDGGKDVMMEHLEKAMRAASNDREREDIRRMMDKLENA